MAEEIREPSVKDQSETEKLDPWTKDFITDLRTKVTRNDIDATETWRAKMQTARNQRQGIKRVTNIPYPGAPDIPLPETDKLIRKNKPAFVLSAMSGKKPMSITAAEGVPEENEELKEKVRKAELAMNNLFTKKIPWVKRLTLAADRFMEKGHCIFKVIMRYNSRDVSRVLDVDRDFTEEQRAEFDDLERDDQIAEISARFDLDLEIDADKETANRILKEYKGGEKVIRFTTEEVTNVPDVLIPNPEKIFVPKGTTDIRKATRITHEYFLPEHEVWRLAEKGIYMKDRTLKILKTFKNIKRGDDEINEKMKDRLAGVSDNEQDGEMIRIHETYTWFQEKKDGPWRRHVFTFFADINNDDDDDQGLIQKIAYPFEMEEWNFVRHDNEVIDENHYRSRGVPEMIRALQEFMERGINNQLIRDEMNNAPMWKVLNESTLLDNNVRFVPGQKLPVGNMGEIERLTDAIQTDVSSERIIQQLKAWAEEYIGSTDQLFRNATNKGGGKTLGEVELGVDVAQVMKSLDIVLWLGSLKDVYTQVFKIMRERLAAPMIVNGEQITREDFNFEPDIMPNGSLEMADKQVQLQKAVLRLQNTRQARADGVATLEDMFNAYEDYLEKDGVTNTDDFITDPNQILTEEITQLEQTRNELTQIIEQQNALIEEGETILQRNEQEIGRGNEGGPAQNTTQNAGGNGSPAR